MSRPGTCPVEIALELPPEQGFEPFGHGEKGVEVELTGAARELIGNLGYDPVYGARPLKRVIQKQLVDRLALKLLDGERILHRAPPPRRGGNPH